MDISCHSMRTMALAVALSASFLAGGCAGPSTRVLPRETTARREPPEEAAVLEEGNPFYLQEELEILAASPRAAGSENEQKAILYIRQLLEGYGYHVTTQDFTFQKDAGGEEGRGTNLAAVRKAPDKEADVLIVAAHHDTAPQSPGANESASGVAALLETARLLSHIPTDTELRFVSFSGHEAGKAGARHYVNSLPEKDRQRVIGAIWLDALGYVLEDEVCLGTTDGKPTLLGDVLGEAGQELLQEEWLYELREEGTHSLFARGRIPSVSVGQKREPYEKGSRFDRPEIVDMERVCQVVNVVSRGICTIMSPDTPSMLAKSRYYNDLRDEAYVQQKDMPVRFGQDVFQTECQMGTKGVLVAENTDPQGNPFRAYRYMVKWFGVDQILLSDYYFTTAGLTSVVVDGDGAGVALEEMRGRLVSVYGQPAKEDEGPYGAEWTWNVPRHRTQVSLMPESEGYLLELKGFPADIEELDAYQVLSSPEGQQLRLNRGSTKEPDLRVQQLAGMASRFLPLKGMAEVESVRIYTDGIGGTQTYLEALPREAEGEEEAGGMAFIWGVDLEDAITLEGGWRNEAEAVRQMLLLYAQMLEQADQGRYLAAFSAAFSGSGQETGQDNLSAPEGADLIHQAQPGVRPGTYLEPPPDFAHSFLWFVLTGRPGSGDGEWGRRIGFFYQFEELAAYRAQIRNNLNMGP